MTLKKPHIWSVGLTSTGGLEWNCGNAGKAIDPLLAKYTVGCQGKQKHASHSEASQIAYAKSKKDGERFVAYPCDFCRRWHVGGDR